MAGNYCDIQKECKIVKKYEAVFEEILKQCDSFAEYFGEYFPVTNIAQIVKKTMEEQ